ncbi:putative xanthine dehydrogenase subunit A [Paraferrimonas haliotis]|uniref:Xanthine dehydrogenase subunit A n=2 Tax=Paraferrimonas haliotis TaxID=2013866 RepID=A0AA37TU00_9GAMM|nr:putative xanthine dehydrogenase subunit A [Paraferrimonas haliotis]
MLQRWQTQKDEFQWVLATVIETQGSSYRKPGAMMLINSMGQHFGLISGGCLESDVMRNARRCWDTGQSIIVQYDMRQEGDFAWQLGIGCGGMVKLLLQPITADNNYLDLTRLLDCLSDNVAVLYQQSLVLEQPHNSVQPLSQYDDNNKSASNQFQHHILPAPLLLILGAGLDAVPLARMALELGWRVVINDTRVSASRTKQFAKAQLLKVPMAQLPEQSWWSHVNAAVVMHHHLQLDADALQQLTRFQGQFIGLLGPSHRTERLVNEFNVDLAELPVALSNPVGLDIGGDLPETIALSILAQVQGVLSGKTAITPSLRLAHAM